MQLRQLLCTLRAVAAHCRLDQSASTFWAPFATQLAAAASRPFSETARAACARRAHFRIDSLLTPSPRYFNSWEGEHLKSAATHPRQVHRSLQLFFLQPAGFRLVGSLEQAFTTVQFWRSSSSESGRWWGSQGGEVDPGSTRPLSTAKTSASGRPTFFTMGRWTRKKWKKDGPLRWFSNGVYGNCDDCGRRSSSTKCSPSLSHPRSLGVSLPLPCPCRLSVPSLCLYPPRSCVCVCVFFCPVVRVSVPALCRVIV